MAMAAVLSRRHWWLPCRRWLYLTHRWLGIAGCLLFAMWFLSGLVMMYVGFPALTEQERLRGLSPLRVGEAMVAPATALTALPNGAGAMPPQRMSLEMLHASTPPEPVWRILDAQGRHHAVSARDGRLLGPFDAGQAEAVARAFYGQSGARWTETLERDQWTVPNGLNPLRPLHHIAVGDAAGSELYVSSRTGEVVRDTTRSERLWNWLGAVPHWIYFTPLRADPPLWHDVVVWVSGACIVSALTGIVIGVMRVRLRGRYRSGAVTPYRGWMAWHHVAGLVGGLCMLSWIASGWLSMNPNGWFAHGSIGAAAQLQYQAPGSAFPWPVPNAPAGARELQLQWFAGRPLAVWRDANARMTVADAATGQPAIITAGQIRQAAARLMSDAPMRRMALLHQEDAYWYGHHHTRVLPVWRLEFGNALETWLHIDPDSGQLLGHSDRAARARRWLFNAAHSLDFSWLIRYRPAWDVVVWALSAIGLLVSVSGVVIAWRRLRR
jgi:hypothetical protein